MGYVDDTKILLSLSPCNASEAVDALNSDLIEVSRWCCANSLLINRDKTKLLVVGIPKLTTSLSLPLIYLLEKQIYPSSVVKDLGVWIESNLTYDEYISKMSLSCLYKSSRINHLPEKHRF